MLLCAAGSCIPETVQFVGMSEKQRGLAVSATPPRLPFFSAASA